MTINELCKQAHENAVAHGFYDNNPSFGALLMQVVEELGEAADADRKGKQCKVSPMKWVGDYEKISLLIEKVPKVIEFEDTIKDTVESEIADAFIILAGMCESRGIDIDAHIQAKLRYNRTRERLHGKEY